MLIPKAAVTLLIKSLADSGECGLYTDKTSVFVKYEDGLFCSRLSSRKFPDYRQLFAKGTSLHVVLELSPVREALKRTLLFSGRIFFHIHPDGNLIIKPMDHGDDSQEEIKLKSSIEKLTKPLQLGLNGVALIQLLEQFEGDEISLNIFSVKAPLLFQGSPNMVGLFMPLNNSR
jgi:DNA polymerase III sliding clamp (beta) subunit (PCNA family)